MITADPEMDVEEAAEKMARQGVRRLVVIDSGTVAGVVTLDDLTPSAGDRASFLSARDHATGDAARTVVASANARTTACARVPSPASSGWKSVPRKNGWPASSSARGAPSSSWAPKITPAASKVATYPGAMP